MTRQFANDSAAAKKDQNYSGAKKADDKANKMFDQSWKRRQNMGKAVDRLAKEEVDQIDELNKDTLYSYAQKANNDMSKKHKELAMQVRGNKPVEANKTSAKLSNRDKGLDRAEKRLNKEEAEQMDERSLSTSEKATMEKNVKGMKKNLAGFKERYGKDAKSVMYATATKQAKGE
jgi:hypothetical protein